MAIDQRKIEEVARNRRAFKAGVYSYENIDKLVEDILEHFKFQYLGGFQMPEWIKLDMTGKSDIEYNWYWDHDEKTDKIFMGRIVSAMNEAETKYFIDSLYQFSSVDIEEGKVLKLTFKGN